MFVDPPPNPQENAVPIEFWSYASPRCAFVLRMSLDENESLSAGLGLNDGLILARGSLEAPKQPTNLQLQAE